MPNLQEGTGAVMKGLLTSMTSHMNGFLIAPRLENVPRISSNPFTCLLTFSINSFVIALAVSKLFKSIVSELKNTNGFW